MESPILVELSWGQIAGAVSGLVAIVGAIINRMWITLQRQIERGREDCMKQNENLHELLQEVLSTNRSLISKESRRARSE